MSSLEKYFLGQLNSHRCQLPPSDDFEYVQQISRFKNFFLISEKSLQGYLKVKSLSAVYYEKRRQVRTTLGLVIHPYSLLRSVCRVLHFFLILAALLYYPFFCAFLGPFYVKNALERRHEPGVVELGNFYAHLGIMTLLQVLSLLQIAVTFMIGYSVEGKEEIVIHLTGIARHYFCTYFIPDLVSSLPLDALLIAARGIEGYGALSWPEISVLSIVPLLKFSRLWTLNLCFRTIYGRFHQSRAACNMVAVIGLYFLIIHWGGCLQMLVSRFFHIESVFPAFFDAQNRDNLLQVYVATIYVSVTALVNTGFDIDEFDDMVLKTMLIFVVIVGKVYRFVILIFFLQLLSIRNAGRLRYMEMMDQVAQYMRMKRFPKELRHKIKINYIYLFRKEYIGEKSILHLLSDNLRREILLRIHQRLIEKVNLFSGLSEDLIFNFVSCLKPEIYLANDVVYRAGDMGECMYFVSFGTVVMYTETKEEVGHLHDGDHFGEVSLIFQLRRTSTVVALETTELYCLDAQDFIDVIKAYPVIYNKVKSLASSRLKLLNDTDFLPPTTDFSEHRLGKKGRRDEGEREGGTRSDSD